MKPFISLLRGINVSGQKMVKMDSLKKLYESLGFSNVRTYIQSGNVIFEAKETDTLKLSKNIESAIKKSFGFDVSVIIRTQDELKRVLSTHPFAKNGTDRLYVVFLSHIPDSIPLDELNTFKAPLEQFQIREKEIYLFYPEGFGRTKLSNALFEKKLKVVATTRNWNTVKTLSEL